MLAVISKLQFLSREFSLPSRAECGVQWEWILCSTVWYCTVTDIWDQDPHVSHGTALQRILVRV
jgi:hypothetical protein